MSSLKIVPYQPNGAARSRRIDPKEWERLRSRIEELYIKDDKKLEEVMKIMALHHYFHASRRQYTPKLNEWGLRKNIPAKVMRSALRKRARAGNKDLSIKFRGTTIDNENMDRWQHRVPTFNPMSSPTASTLSEMDVEPLHAMTSEQQGNTLHSPIARSPPIDAVSDNSGPVFPAASDDDVIGVAYHEIRRSVSPQVAEYIFQDMEDGPSPQNNLAGAGWTTDHILNILVTESELRKLSSKSLEILAVLGSNLWKFGEAKYLKCCAHINEVLLARDSLVGSETRVLDIWRRNLAVIYLEANRIAECATLLMSTIAEIDSLRPDDPACNQFRSLLGIVYLRQGNRVLAEELCTQAMVSQRSTLGLTHKVTWSAYNNLRSVLEGQRRFGDSRRLMMEFYTDIYQTVSPQVLSGLIFSLELCERCIDEWMAESELQRLVRDRFVNDVSLSIGGRMSLTLTTLIAEKWRVDLDSGIVPQILLDLEDITDVSVPDILTKFALLVAWRIQPVQDLDSILLRQGALQVAKDLRSTRFLAPLLVFCFLNGANFWDYESYWRKAEQDLIHSLENVANEYETIPEDGRNLQLSDDVGGPKSTSVMMNGHATPRFDLPNSSDSFIRATTASAQASSAPISSHTIGFDIGTPMSRAVSSATFFRPIPELSSAYSLPAWNSEPYPLQSRHSAAGGQLLSDNQSNSRFSRTVMDTLTSPFTFSLPQTPRASRMFTLPRPGQDSPATMPSSVLIGHLDFSGFPNLFGLPESPIPPPPSFAPGSSPTW